MDTLQTNAVQFSLAGLGTVSLVGKQAQFVRMALFALGIYLLYKYLSKPTINISIT